MNAIEVHQSIYGHDNIAHKTPFKEMSGEEWLLQLNYKVLLLWKLEAQQFVQDHVVGMYALLPAMKGANAPILLQAIKEMELKYKFPQLGHHLVRFRTVLRRSKTLSEQDKRLVEEHMQTYDSLLDSDPYLQQKIALERKLERNEALQAFRDTLIEITRNRFPALTEIAQRRVAHIQTIESLQQLVVQLSLAPDQASARRLLQNSSVD